MNYDPHRHHRRSIRLKGYDYSRAGAYFITICCHDRICRFGEIVGDVGAGLAPALLPPAQIDDMENVTSSNVQTSNKKGQPQGPAHTMQLNEYGKIAYNEWVKLPERYPNFELDVFQIMPNHIHGIIVLNDVRAGLAPALLPPAQIDEMIKGQPQGTAPTPLANIDEMIKGRPQGTAPTPLANIDGMQKGQPQGTAPTPLANIDEMIKGRPQGTAPTPLANIDGMQKGQPQGIAPTVGDIVGAYKSLVANGCLTIFKKNNEKMGKLWQRDYYEHVIRDDQSYQTISNYILNNPAKWTDDKFYKQ
jgi:REP element-mobilizing transposase RayT